MFTEMKIQNTEATQHNLALCYTQIFAIHSSKDFLHVMLYLDVLMLCPSDGECSIRAHLKPAFS